MKDWNTAWSEIVANLDDMDAEPEELLVQIWLEGENRPVEFTTTSFQSPDGLLDFMVRAIVSKPFLTIDDTQHVRHLIRCERISHATVQSDEVDSS